MKKGGRPRVKLTRTVNVEELDREIRKARRDKLPRYLERLQALRALAQGATREEVADLVGRHSQTVRTWIQSWNASGFEGLHPDFKGDPTCKLAEAQIIQLKEDLRRPPSHFGYLSGLWDIKTVHHHIERIFDVTYNISALYRSLKNWGIKLRTPRPQSALQDPVQVESYWTETVPQLLRKKKP